MMLFAFRYKNPVVSISQTTGFFIALLLLASSCRPCPELMRKGVKTEYRQLAFSLVVPKHDRNNGLEAVFVQEKYSGEKVCADISLVFLDEDQPFFLFDWIYDGYRRHHYGRKRDIETIRAYYDRKTGQPDSIVFPGTYSNQQKFRKGFVEHYAATVHDFPQRDKNGLPVVYVNTWNHLFSEKDQNKRLKKDTISHFLVFEGNRDSAEKYLDRAK